MSINYPISNIIHGILFNKGIGSLNIAYNSIGGLYDLAINDLNKYQFISDDMLFDNKLINYGLSFINDPVNYSQNIEKYKKLYSNKILFMHNPVPNFFKKEDVFLMNSHLSNHTIYSFTNSQPEVLPNKKYIKYGLKIRSTKASSDRSNNVAILYNAEEKQAKILHSVISSKFPNIELIDTKSIKDIVSIEEKLNNTKICIDTTDYYNVLFGVSCGCYGLTSVVNNDNTIISRIDNFENCLNIIEQILSSYSQDTIDKSQQYLEANYNYDSFVTIIDTIISNNYYISVQL